LGDVFFNILFCLLLYLSVHFFFFCFCRILRWWGMR
jgi:hypothetical protein